MDKTTGRKRTGKKTSARKTQSSKASATRLASAAAKIAAAVVAKPATTRGRKAAAAKTPTARRSAGTTNTATKRSRAGRSAAGKRSQASAGKASAGKRSQAGGKQHQDTGLRQRQGDSTMSPATPMFGGTKQVMIEEAAMTSRGGRPPGPEPYPFGDLTPSRVEKGGVITGPSFFVPNSENPKKVIASGRKRHKPDGKVFLTRQMEGPSVTNPEIKVPGVRVWLAPANYGK